MKLIVINEYPKAIDLAFSTNFIVTANGYKATVYDRKTNNQLVCFDNLDYGCFPYITSNEEFLIICGTSKTLYLYSLKTLEFLYKLVLNTTNCQFSNCVISPDNKYLFCILHRNDLSCSLLKIELESFKVVEEYFNENKLFLFDIKYIPTKGKYLIHGFDRDSSYNNRFIMWFDENSVERHDIEDNLMLMLNFIIHYDESENHYHLYDLLDYRIIILDDRYEINKIITIKIEMTPLNDEYMRDIIYDNINKVIYMATTNALYVIDFASGKIIDTIVIKYGYMKLKLIDSHLYASTYSSNEAITEFKLII